MERVQVVIIQSREMYNMAHISSPTEIATEKIDNRREIVEVAARFFKGRSKVADQSQSPPVCLACTNAQKTSRN